VTVEQVRERVALRTVVDHVVVVAEHAAELSGDETVAVLAPAL
jgi:hypothetical protein